MNVESPASAWRQGPFRLNTQPHLEQLAQYNPTLPLAHERSSDEVREEVHQRLAENQAIAIDVSQDLMVEQEAG